MFLTQLEHIKFLRAHSEVWLFNYDRVTRKPSLAGKDKEHWKLSIAFKISENLLLAQIFPGTKKISLVSTL